MWLYFQLSRWLFLRWNFFPFLFMESIIDACCKKVLFHLPLLTLDLYFCVLLKIGNNSLWLQMLSFVERRITAQGLYTAWFLWVMIILFYHSDTVLIVAFLQFTDLEEPTQNIEYLFQVFAALEFVKLMVHLFQWFLNLGARRESPVGLLENIHDDF